MEPWVVVLIAIGCVILGLVGGYFGARWLFKRELQKNPPINEKMIRAMFTSMGKKPSEAQIRSIMNNVRKNQ